MIWLLEGLRPVYKTISDFRKDNVAALKTVNRDFILLCKELSLLGGEEIAIDGSFFKADTSKSNIYTEKQLSQQLAKLDEKIAAYQDALAQQDDQDDKADKGGLVEDEQLAEKLKQLLERQTQKNEIQTHVDFFQILLM